MGGINWEIRIHRYTLLYIKQVTNKDLLYSTGNSTQYSVITYMGKESEKDCICIYIHIYMYMYMHIHITDSLCCIAETNTAL